MSVLMSVFYWELIPTQLDETQMLLVDRPIKTVYFFNMLPERPDPDRPVASNAGARPAMPASLPAPMPGALSTRAYCRLLLRRHGIGVSPPGLMKWQKSGLQLDCIRVGRRRMILDTIGNDARIAAKLAELARKRARPDWQARLGVAGDAPLPTMPGAAAMTFTAENLLDRLVAGNAGDP
ncbi:MAG: hypothetical protein EHM21_13755 [Chloroflexi bacterium]|nr:MAG: hypothetical protein EHM21_13755 [Chloroflexota bacterium]